MRLSAVLATAAAAAVVSLASAGAYERYQFDEHTVDTVDFEFLPQVITVTVGDTVNWVAPATNEEEHTIHEDETSLFDGLVFPGQTFSHRFTRTGTFTYHCDIHPADNMVGTVIVEARAEPLPPEAPETVSATAGDGQATLVWSAPFDGGSPITGYTVTASPGGATTTVTGTGATITGLSNGTTYTFDVRATNAVGDGPAATSGPVTPTGDEEPGEPGPCPPGTPPAPFADRDAIPAAHRANVDCAAALDIVAGRADNTYGPTAGVRRDQMASFIARALAAVGVELPAPSADRFADVSPGSTHDEAIHRLAAAGIVQGGAGGADGRAYGPAQTVRRDQMASFLLRAASFAADQDLASQSQAFSDVGSSNPHFANVNGAAEAGLAQGSADGTYRPGAGVRRDQMGTFVIRLAGYLTN